MGTECSLDEVDTGLKTPCEVLVGLPARDLHCNRKHARTFCFVFSFFLVKGIRAFSFSRPRNRTKNCEGGAAGPPFGVVEPNEDFALGPAYSRSPCPLARPLRLTTTVTDPDSSQPVA